MNTSTRQYLTILFRVDARSMCTISPKWPSPVPKHKNKHIPNRLKRRPAPHQNATKSENHQKTLDQTVGHMKRGKFDISITIGDEDGEVCAAYHKCFAEYNMLNDVQVVRNGFADSGRYDCVIVPYPTCYGLVSVRSSIGPLVSMFGPNFEENVKKQVVKKYLGEQPLGTAMILPTGNRRFKFAAVVPLFRVSKPNGTDMQWLEESHVSSEYAYTAMRGALLSILRFNTASSDYFIGSVFCPDMYKMRVEVGVPVGPNALPKCARQIMHAIKGILHFRNKAQAMSWTEADLNEREIFCVNMDTRSESSSPNVSSNGGVLEQAGIYSLAELDELVKLARESSDPDIKLRACKALGSCLQNTTEFGLSIEEISLRITDKNSGCLPQMLEYVQMGELTVHREIDMQEIVKKTAIGDGTAGRVYRGYWGETPVAIKQFTKDFDHDLFMRELSIMTMVQHDSLVKSYGGVSKGKKYLIMANLSDLLLSKQIPLDMGMKLKIAINIAEGMYYLHRHCNIIHRDLKTLNLLIRSLEDKIEIKICDFGMSRMIDHKRVMTGNVGTVSYIAPEVFEQKKYNERADIYSYGIILWEIVTREVAFSTLNSFSIPIAVIKGDRPPISNSLIPIKELRHLIKSFWHQNPKRRPVFKKIIQRLKPINMGLKLEERSQTRLDLSSVQKKGTSSRSNDYLSVTEDVLRSTSSTSSSYMDIPQEDEDSSEPSTEEYDTSETISAESSTTARTPEEPMTVTCVVPSKWAKPIAELEINVNSHFSKLNQNIDRGTLKVGNERYVLFRANSLSVDFVSMVANNYDFNSAEDSLEFSQNFLYDLGYSIGKADAHNFSKHNKNYTDIVALNNAALVFIAYTGIAYVELSPDTVYSEDPKEELMVMDFVYSFESTSWCNDIAECNGCTCVIGSGYMSGWGEVMTGSVQAAAEVLCKARGDDRCLVIRSIPHLLDDKVAKYCKKHKIRHHSGLPKFLRNRRDTNPNFYAKNFESEDENENWLSKSFKKIFKPHGKNESKHNTVLKNLEPGNLQLHDICRRASNQLDRFLIDPRSGTVELADDNCVLIRADSISRGFFSLVHELLEHTDSIKQASDFASQFLFDLGKSIGMSNRDWFVDKMSLTNSIDKLTSLPVNMQYLGWSNMKYTCGLNIKHLKKADFEITCECSTSFEAASWIKKREVPNGTACFMHCGFIAGWFEKCLGMDNIVCVETQCRVQGAKRCCFTIGPESKILKTVADDVVQRFSYLFDDSDDTDVPYMRHLRTQRLNTKQNRMDRVAKIRALEGSSGNRKSERKHRKSSKKRTGSRERGYRKRSDTVHI